MRADPKLGLLVGLVAAVATSCASQPEIFEAEASGDGLNLHFSMNECHGEYRVDVHEDEEKVRVTITDQRRRTPFSGGDDCSDRVGPVLLAKPLADRRLVDRHGNNISVDYSPWNQAKHSAADFAAAVGAAAKCVAELDPEATVEIVTHRDGYPVLDVTLPELDDGESRRDMAPMCIERHIEPLRR